ncbi:hypothetical protein niasHT_002732 [Heterodera trifolii]|uniref:Uncharacterized protein n=1 Tax=Heterodera trifolii TaxID=157864 RepID=A0ABD2MAJ4_9BILA
MGTNQIPIPGDRAQIELALKAKLQWMHCSRTSLASSTTRWCCRAGQPQDPRRVGTVLREHDKSGAIVARQFVPLPLLSWYTKLAWAAWRAQFMFSSFVRPENLGLHSKIKCDNCGTYEVRHNRQLTLRKLPIRQKIKYPVRYPEFIDLTPYTTTHRNAIASGDQQQLRKGSSRRHLTSLTD